MPRTKKTRKVTHSKKTTKKVTTDSQTPTRRKLKINISSKTLNTLKKALVIIMSILAVDALAQLYYKNTIIAETPQGYRIKKSLVVNQLLKSKTPTTAEQIIQVELAKEVVFKEAKKKRLTVTNEEIKQKIDEIKKQYSSDEEFKLALESNGLTEESFRDLIKAQILLQKLVEPEYKEPNEKELKEFFEQIKKNNPKYQDKKFEEVKDEVSKDFKNSKIAMLEAEWMDKHLQPVQQSLVIYTQVPFRYTVGGGLVRLPVIREIAPVLEKKYTELKNKLFHTQNVSKEATESTTKQETTTPEKPTEENKDTKK